MFWRVARNVPQVDSRYRPQAEKLSARMVFNLIVRSAWKNGEPGILFLDQINRDHPAFGEIESTHPECGGSLGPESGCLVCRACGFSECL
jgi:ribonucleotide reductase alpha subunit